MADQKTFEEWMVEVKNLARENGAPEVDIETMDFETDYWEELYSAGKSPKDALKQDQSEF